MSTTEDMPGRFGGWVAFHLAVLLVVYAVVIAAVYAVVIVL